MRTNVKVRSCVAAALVVAGCGVAIVLGQDAAQTRGVDVCSLFSPSGFMGDGEYAGKYVTFSGADRTAPHSLPTSVKVTYTIAPNSPNRWAGMYWLNEPDNWGDRPGTNYSGRRLSSVSFWARGETGTEVVEFKAGGINNPKKKYHDSFSATIGRVTLSREWRRYVIDIKGADLTSVIGAFCWVVSADFNPGNRVIFYLDDVYME
jgi:hypothetical protein